jgi:hypothetical protein
LKVSVVVKIDFSHLSIVEQEEGVRTLSPPDGEMDLSVRRVAGHLGELDLSRGGRQIPRGQLDKSHICGA